MTAILSKVGRKSTDKPIIPTILRRFTSTSSTSGISHTPKSHSIVSTFLCLTPPPPPPPSSPSPSSTPRSDPFRIAIFKRRRPGHVYHGKWAVVSGRVETQRDETALQAALREVREETGLDGAAGAVEILQEGTSFVQPDAALGVEWRITPFLMRVVLPRQDGEEEALVSEALRRIKLDEEHEEVRFIGPGEVAGYDTVDGLAGTLEALLEEYREARRED